MIQPISSSSERWNNRRSVEIMEISKRFFIWLKKDWQAANGKTRYPFVVPTSHPMYESEESHAQQMDGNSLCDARHGLNFDGSLDTPRSDDP